MSQSFSLPPIPDRGFSRSPEYQWARLSADAPRIPWDVFVLQELNWRQGEHFGLIGPTGQGKTTMLLNILPIHHYVAVFGTKPRDVTMDRLAKSGYTKMKHWRSLNPRDTPRRLVWPNARRLDSRVHQKQVFTDAFDRIYLEGGWTVAIDELWFFTNMLNMEEYIKLYLLQARSLGISLLAATQRPANVPLEVYDQSTHLMFWRDNDRRNLDRLSEINSRDAALVREIVRNLDEFQVLYVNTRTGKMLRTRVPLIGGQK